MLSAKTDTHFTWRVQVCDPRILQLMKYVMLPGSSSLIQTAAAAGVAGASALGREPDGLTGCLASEPPRLRGLGAGLL